MFFVLTSMSKKENISVYSDDPCSDYAFAAVVAEMDSGIYGEEPPSLAVIMASYEIYYDLCNDATANGSAVLAPAIIN